MAGEDAKVAGLPRNLNFVHVLADKLAFGCRDLQVQNVVKDLAEYATGILAFGIGLVFGLTFEPGMLRRRRRAVAGEGAAPAATTTTTTPARAEFDRTAADEPVAAERREVGDEPVVDAREAERREAVRRQ